MLKHTAGSNENADLSVPDKLTPLLVEIFPMYLTTGYANHGKVTYHYYNHDRDDPNITSLCGRLSDEERFLVYDIEVPDHELATLCDWCERKLEILNAEQGRGFRPEVNRKKTREEGSL